MLDNIRKTLICLLIACVIATTGFVGKQAYVFIGHLDQTTIEFQTTIRHLDNTFTLANNKIARLDVDQFNSIKTDVLKTVNIQASNIQTLTDRHLTNVEDIANTQLSKITDATVIEIKGSKDILAKAIDNKVDPILAPVKKTLDIVGENAELFGNCMLKDETGQTDGYVPNENCIANWALPTINSIKDASQSTARTMKVFETKFPEMTDTLQKTNTNFEGITNDAHKITTKFTQPTPWYKKVATGFMIALGTAAKIIF